MHTNPYNACVARPSGAAPLGAVPPVGVEGEAAATPHQQFRGTRNVAGPITGPESTSHLVDLDTCNPRKRKGRPRSARQKRKVALCPRACALIDALPPGDRCRAVERAILLLLDGPGPMTLMSALPELRELSLRVQQLLEVMQRRDLTPEQQAKLNAAACATIARLNRLTEP